MDRRHLEYLIAITEHGGFGRAAAHLNLTQSALSQTVAQLERELGVDLFHRRMRPVRLTTAGEAIVEPARQTLKGFTTIASTAASINGLAAGNLDIATLPTLAQWPATPLVAAFRREYPAVRIHIVGPQEPRIEELAQTVRHGQAEIGLTERGTSPQALVERSLGSHDYVAVLPPGSTISPGVNLTYAEVLNMGIIIGPWWENSRPYLAIRAHCPDLVDEAVTIRIDHRETYVPLILAGAGAAILPRFVGQMAQAAGAVIADLTPPISRDVALIHRDTALTPAGSAFINLATRDCRTTCEI